MLGKRFAKMATQQLTPPRKPWIIEEYLESFMSTNWGSVSLKQTLGGGVKDSLCSSLLGEMNDPIWLIFFKWVDTTNQKIIENIVD